MQTQYGHAFRAEIKLYSFSPTQLDIVGAGTRKPTEINTDRIKLLLHLPLLYPQTHLDHQLSYLY